MNCFNGKNVFFALGLFLLLFVSSCKNEENHSPCGRPDCSLVKMIHTDNGVQTSIINQTYTTAGGKKLLAETYWDIMANNASIKINNQYDNQARLVEFLSVTTTNIGTNTSKIIYEYDTTRPARLVKSTSYGNTNNVVGYVLYSYSGTLDKPIRQDNYDTQNQIVAHKEFEYDANENLTKEVDYQTNFLNSRITYSNYTSDGEWQSKLYENFKRNPTDPGFNTEETTRVFENCTLKSTLMEYDSGSSQKIVNTIENDLIVSTLVFDELGNQLGLETTYEYNCD